MKKPIVLAILLACALPASAYKTTTHVAITHNAIINSNLWPSSSSEVVLGQLDLARLILLNPTAPFSGGDEITRQYIALQPVATFRSPTLWVAKFEDDTIEDVATARPGPSVDHSLESWILRGAIREDDNLFETTTSEEPGGIIMRVFGHFYEPVGKKGLTVQLFGEPKILGPIAQEWSHTNNASVWGPLGGGPNVFNLPSTKEAMWRALTGLTNEGKDATPGATGSAPANESVRKTYWASTFRSLGNALHLIEDMAQPQHTRNDAHSGVGCKWGDNSECVGGHDSFYEGYIGALTTRTKEIMKTRTILLLLVVLSPVASAYNTPPHVAITHNAIPNSNL